MMPEFFRSTAKGEIIIMKMAVIYARVADPKQMEKLSLGTQEKICREYCERNDIVVDRVFIEKGDSAKTADRTEFQVMLGYCRQNKNRLDFVVVYTVNRFARNSEDRFAVAGFLRRLGMCLRSATEPIDETPAGKFVESMLAAVAMLVKLVVGDFAPRNTERFEIFARIAAETSRRLLVQPKDAYLLRAIHLADPNRPDLMASPHVAIYDDPKGVHRKYESAVRSRYAELIVAPAEVCRHRGDYILAFNLTDMADLLDLEFLRNGPVDGVYIFSNSPAFDDEQQVDLVRLWSWTQHLGSTLIGLTSRRDGCAVWLPCLRPCRQRGVTGVHLPSVA